MFISIRSYIGCRNIHELSRLARTRLLPVIRELEGFKTFMLIELDDDTAATMTVFATREQAEAANGIIQGVIRTEFGTLAPNPPEVLVGQVLWETRW